MSRQYIKNIGDLNECLKNGNIVDKINIFKRNYLPSLNLTCLRTLEFSITKPQSWTQSQKSQTCH